MHLYICGLPFAASLCLRRRIKNMRTDKLDVIVVMLLSTATAMPTANFMDCGNATLCGVLTLETGLGPGPYHHDFVSVHGLWPETPLWQLSQCIAPSNSTADPAKVYKCYNHPGGAGMGLLEFEQHEWEKHGRCAGVRDAVDFSRSCARCRRRRFP